MVQRCSALHSAFESNPEKLFGQTDRAQMETANPVHLSHDLLVDNDDSFWLSQGIRRSLVVGRRSPFTHAIENAYNIFRML